MNVLIAVVAGALALWLAADAGVEGPSAAPEVARTLGAMLVLCLAAGYAPARLLLPRSMQPHLALLALPIGAAFAGLLFTMVGFAHVPLDISLPVVLVVGTLAAVAVRVRLGPARPEGEEAERAGPPQVRALLPLWIAALVVALALIPVFRAGEATVVGQNADAIQWVGSWEILQDAAPPSELDEDRALDRVPLVWRSKYPIYYFGSAVSTLSGLEPRQTFAIVSAGVFGLLALAFHAFAFYVLRAGPLAALAAMAVVPLSRWVLYLPIHPYYNQLWGLTLLALTYVFGLRFLLEPGRRTAALAVGFGSLGAFVYPLMIPFPALVLGLSARLIRRRRQAAGEPVRWLSALRLPRPRRALVWIPVGLLALPFVLVLVVGVLEKLGDFSRVLLPGKDLSHWQGGDPYLAFPAFVGIPGTSVLSAAAAAAVLVVGFMRLRRSPAEVAVPLVAAGVLGLLGALYFRLREDGELLYYRSLGFSAPFVLAAAGVALAELKLRLPGPLRAVRPSHVAAAALAALVACATLGTRAELDNTFSQLDPDTAQIEEFGEGVPRDASIRIDLPPDAYQFWARHLLHEHPLSVSRAPLGTIFPHPPLGRKADYVLGRPNRRPRDADGAPLAANVRYALWRMRESVPGPDRSSRRLIDAYSTARE